MAGNAGNWFKGTRKGGGSAKGRVYISNAAIAKFVISTDKTESIASKKKRLAENPELVKFLASRTPAPKGMAITKAAADEREATAKSVAAFVTAREAMEEAARVAVAAKEAEAKEAAEKAKIAAKVAALEAAVAAKKEAAATARKEKAAAKRAVAKEAASYTPLNPRSPGPAPTASLPTSRQTMVASYVGSPSRSFDVPDQDPITLTYPDGKTVTVSTAGKSLASAQTKLKSWYEAWGRENAPGTTGYNVVTKRYQTPAYRAINTYLRMKEAGASPSEITRELQTNSEVTYSGGVFSPGSYGNYPGAREEYTYEGMKRIADALDKSLSSTLLPETTVMYRGITRSTPKAPNPMADAIFSGKPGDMMPGDPAPQSLSLNKNWSLNYATKPHRGGPGVMMTIIVPKGAKGAYLPANGGVTREAEYLLKGGVNYRLVSKERDAATGLIHAVLEVVN